MNPTSEDSSAGPSRPPGLLPLPGDRLWKPHEEKYWMNLREQWGSTLDLNDDEDDIDHANSHIRQLHNDENHSRTGHGSEEGENMHDIDLCTANGTVFRIVLAHGEQGAQECDSGGIPATRRSHDAATVTERPTVRYINQTPLADAVALHLPPPAVHKPSGKKALKSNALTVSVTTSTRTYGDFSKMNPPPYTPRPTNGERGWDRQTYDGYKQSSKWPVAKWLFVLGFLFPLLWLFGSFLLFSGLRKLSADSQPESQDSTSSKSDTRSGDTSLSSRTNRVPQLIAQEVRWSKRCAVAFVLLAVACFIALGVLKAVGM